MAIEDIDLDYCVGEEAFELRIGLGGKNEYWVSFSCDIDAAGLVAALRKAANEIEEEETGMGIMAKYLRGGYSEKG